MAARRRNERQSRSNAGTVFWLAAIVIVLFIFALNWGKVQETLSRTNFHEIIKTNSASDKNPPAATAPKGSGEQGGPRGAGPDALSPDAAVPHAPTAAVPETDATQTSAGPKAQAKPEPPVAVPTAGAQGVQSAQGADQASQDAARGADAARPTKGAITAVKTRLASLFFVRIDDDGVIVRQEVKRPIALSDSPLIDSLAALMKGPSEDEIRKHLVSLVPQGTKLLSAQVRGSTAFLNFNEAFMYNHYGIEGYAGQLKQVVYTATSFPTVQDVQILIEGERHDYLGGEGVYIGKPLSRNSF
jgi:germination protein M